MKRTLLVCAHYPRPENAGTNMRTMNFVRYFRELGPVDIVYSNLLPGAVTGCPSFRNEHFLRCESNRTFRGRVRRWADIRDRPLPVARYDADSERFLLSLIGSNDYDYILVRYVINAWTLFKLPPVYRSRTVIDFDDVVSGPLYESMIAASEGLFRRCRLRLNRKFLVRYEKRCLAFGASLFCSDKDNDAVAGGVEVSNAYVVPNTYENESFAGDETGEGYDRGPVLLFVGSLDYKPNTDGLAWFVQGVFQPFKKEYPDAVLMVVGRSPSPEVRSLCGRGGVELCADVSDVGTYYKRCRAVVVPLLTGGGTRIKILEAALAGRPVLSTPPGAQGLLMSDGKEILLFRNAAEFSAQYAGLFDREHYFSITRNAKRLVENHYSFQNFREEMDKVVYHLDFCKGSEDSKESSLNRSGRGGALPTGAVLHK